MQVDPSYGICWDDPTPLDDETGVEVPDVEFQLSQEQQHQLHQLLQLDPLSDDGNYGINHYCELLDFISSNRSLFQQ